VAHRPPNNVGGMGDYDINLDDKAGVVPTGDA
jgi:hypothetical protein